MSMAVLQVLALLAFFPSLAPGCFCFFPFPSQREAIVRSFCSQYPLDVFVAKVIAVTCSCSSQPLDATGLYFPPNTTFSCQSFILGGSGAVLVESVARTKCNVSGPFGPMLTCMELHVKAAGNLSLENATLSLPPLLEGGGPEQQCQQACLHSNTTPPKYAYNPCLYSVEVTDVFKGTQNTGIAMSYGPDVTSTCGELGRVLEIGESYLAGIGGPCEQLHSWPSLSEVSSSNIDLLEELRSTPSLCNLTPTPTPTPTPTLLPSPIPTLSPTPADNMTAPMAGSVCVTASRSLCLVLASTMLGWLTA